MIARSCWTSSGLLAGFAPGMLVGRTTMNALAYMIRVSNQAEASAFPQHTLTTMQPKDIGWSLAEDDNFLKSGKSRIDADGLIGIANQPGNKGARGVLVLPEVTCMMPWPLKRAFDTMPHTRISTFFWLQHWEAGVVAIYGGAPPACSHLEACLLKTATRSAGIVGDGARNQKGGAC
jgi:hypothetical protein